MITARPFKIVANIMERWQWCSYQREYLAKTNLIEVMIDMAKEFCLHSMFLKGGK